MNREFFYKKRHEYILNKKGNDSGIDIKNELQESHFIVPADNHVLVEKAVTFGCQKGLEILDKYGISLEDVSIILETQPETVYKIVKESFHADLILIDGEDATALNPENIKMARENAIHCFNNRTNYVSKIYYRPSGMDLEYCIDDIFDVLEKSQVNHDGRYTVDGIIFPKVESAEEILIITDLLSEIERNKGLDENSIKLEFLIESARGVEFLYEIANSCRDRLTGIIFGMADYSSELGISSLEEFHPLFQYVKTKIINTCAIFNVPAIDCMSFNYPVPDKSLDAEENKKKILNSLKHLHDLFINSIEMGMHGKWVGHPLQLLAVKIAAEKFFNSIEIETFKKKLRAYSESQHGALVIQGAMADRATDRSTRSFLRRAVLKKKIDPAEAFALGIINKQEHDLLLSDK